MVEKLKFMVHNAQERWRVETLQSKEPGTIAWLEKLRRGDCFYDIGANIGVYTLLAAQAVGPSGKVFAFEPHVPSAASLIDNIVANDFQDRVTLLTVALTDESRWDTFQYKLIDAGTTGSQVGKAENEFGNSFAPVCMEMKRCVSLDSLPIPPPDMVKIDVDGGELAILRGMNKALETARSVQVEVCPRDAEAIDQLMTAKGLAKVGMHYTAMGEVHIREGGNPGKVVHNAVYERGR